MKKRILHVLTKYLSRKLIMYLFVHSLPPPPSLPPSIHYYKQGYCVVVSAHLSNKKAHVKYRKGGILTQQEW